MTGIQLIDYDIDIRVAKDASGKIDTGFALADILPQNQALILTMHKGELKEDISVGVGLSDMLLDNDILAWRSEIREQMELDGQTVNSVQITTERVIIDSKY